jgi:hypothetical protein
VWTMDWKYDKCNKEDDVNLCRFIIVQIEAEKQKNLSYCDEHLWKWFASKCRRKVASKLAMRELDKKYCDLLDESWKERCLAWLSF